MEAAMKRHLWAVLLLILPAVGAVSAQTAGVELRILPNELPAGGRTTAHLTFSCPGANYVSKDSLDIQLLEAPEGVTAGESVFPEAGHKYDETLEQEVAYFDGRFTVKVPLSAGPGAAAGPHSVSFRVSYLLCGGALCRIESAEVDAPITVTPSSAQPAPAPAAAPAEEPVEERTDQLAEKGLLARILLCFVAGLGLTLTPCIYPLIPVTVSIVGATSGRGRLDGLLRSVVYVFGLSVTYSAVGVVAAATGGMFGAVLQHPIVYLALAVIFALMAGAMFDWYRMDFSSQRVQKYQARLQGKAGLLGIWMIGLLSGAAATACLAPIITAILVYVGQRGDLVLGFLMFFALAWGVGTPLIVLGTFTGVLKSLPSSGEWMLRVKQLFGLALLGVAVYFVGRSGVLPSVWYRVFVGAFLTCLSVFVGGFDRLLPQSGAWLRARKAAGLLLLGAGLAVLLTAAAPFLPGTPMREASGPRVDWLHSEPEAVERAEELNRPLLLDFRSDDCPACVKLLKETFPDPRVVAESRRFVCAKLDLTDRGDPEVQRLIEKYDVRGVPLVVLVDSAGRRHSYPEYIPPDRMLKLMRSVH